MVKTMTTDIFQSMNSTDSVLGWFNSSTTTSGTTPYPNNMATQLNKTTLSDRHGNEMPLFAKLTIAFQMIIMVVIVVGNVLVLVAVVRYKHLRDITGLFVANLATADLVTGLSLPFQMAFFYHPHLERNKFACLLRYQVISFSCNASAYSLLCTVLDRYIAIAHPFKYVRIMTNKVAYTLIGIIWLVDLLISLIPLFGAHNWEIAPMCLYEIVISKYFRCFNVLHQIAISLIIFLIYFKIFLIVRSQLRRIHMESVFNIGDTTSRPSKQMNRVIGMVVLCFQISWLPFFIVQLMLLEDLTQTKVLVANFLVFLGILNSTINPFIYSWKNRQFRQAFRKLLCFHLEVDEIETTISVI